MSSRVPPRSVTAYDDRVIESMQLVYGDGFLSPGGREEVCRIVAGLALGQRVLDVGCGLGGPAIALVQDAGAERVLGIDVQQPVLDRAGERVRAAGLADRIELRRVASGPFPFPDETFDVVYVTSVICHIEDLAPFLSQCRRVLRPGGHLVGTDWFTVPADAAATRAFEAWATELGERGLDFHFAPLDAFERHLDALGFDRAFEDTSGAVSDEARATLVRIQGPLRVRLVEILGEVGYQRFVRGGQARIRALQSKSLVHCRFRAKVNRAG